MRRCRSARFFDFASTVGGLREEQESKKKYLNDIRGLTKEAAKAE
ncbi:MAG: hypothetical protein ACREBG_16005 [Pyrinomonadaceae bacterium]